MIALSAATAGLAALLAPGAVRAFIKYRDAQKRAHVMGSLAQPMSPVDEEILDRKIGLVVDDDDEEVGRHETADDALRRRVANRMAYGKPTARTLLEQAKVARAEAARWAPTSSPPRRMANADADTRSADQAVASDGAEASLQPAIAGVSWVNLGPTNANFEWNGT